MHFLNERDFKISVKKHLKNVVTSCAELGVRKSFSNHFLNPKEKASIVFRQ